MTPQWIKRPTKAALLPLKKALNKRIERVVSARFERIERVVSARFDSLSREIEELSREVAHIHTLQYLNTTQSAIAATASTALPVRLRVPHVTHPFFIFGTRDDPNVTTLRSDGYYEPHVMELMSRVVRSDSVCLDVGAHIGLFTTALATYARKGIVYAIEPSSQNFSFLKQNILANHLSNVRALHMGVLTKPAQLALNSIQIGPERTADLREQDDSTVALVLSLSLDAFIRCNAIERIDVINLSAEGLELGAIQGAEELLQIFRPSLFLHYNSRRIPDSGNGTYRDLYDALRNFWTHIYIIEHSSDASSPRPIESFDQLDSRLAHGEGRETLFCSANSLP